MDSFSIILRYSRVFLEKRLKKYNISYNEQIILMYISKNEYTNQDNIAKNFITDKGTVAKSIKKLEEKNLILRKENPNNKRENVISLSQNGRNIISHMNELLIQWQGIIFKDFCEEEIKQMKSIKDKMISNMSNYIDNED